MADRESKEPGQTVYLVRHQAAGLLTSHIFLAPPTDEQVAPLRAECERLHGKIHPKRQTPYWIEIEEARLLKGEIPVFPKREEGGGKANVAGVPNFSVSGTGTVTPPKG
jgi:hypothetical protein